ncbi:MAG TPA: hypothetical protein DCM87_01155 [Planctomycetes bacterium]|nr:hypothetical protein [Planctomycetota bacterium]
MVTGGKDMSAACRIRMVAAAAVAACGFLGGATLTVDPSGAGGAFTAIQPAIDAASAGDIVVVLPGTYVVSAPLSFLGKAVTVRSRDGAAATTIRMADTPADAARASIVVFGAADGEGAVLEGFTLAGGLGCDAALDIFEAGLRGRCGGAVLATGGKAGVRGCTIAGNRADVGGGVCAMGGSELALTDCTLTANEAHEGGGLAALHAAPALSGCTISGNRSLIAPWQHWRIDGDGGGVFLRGIAGPDTPKSATFAGCTIADNRADDNGGGIFAGYNVGVAFADTTVARNGGRNGGGVYLVSSGFMTAVRCTIDANHAREFGGGIHGDYGGCTLDACAISANTCGDGSEAYGGNGGGVYFSYMTLVCTNSRFVRNSAAGNGGGMWLGDTSPVRFANCAFLDNAAGYEGGGIMLYYDTVEFEHCTIAGNAASNRGGGVHIFGGNNVRFSSSIVWGNAGGAFFPTDPQAQFAAERSCIELPAPWPGTGNINADPRFCGWGGAGEVFVDGAAPAPGDGTAAHPFSALASAFQFDYALAAGLSPCIGGGLDGTNMGADTGVRACATPPAGARTINVAGGTYSMGGNVLSNHASLVGGAGGSATVLEGTVAGLRTGATLESATVAAGSGVRVAAGEAPSILGVTAIGNRARYGAGLFCGAGSAPVVTDCVIEGNTALESGGGCFLGDLCSARISRTRIRGNSTTALYLAPWGGGGGVFCGANCSAELADSLIVENWSYCGGALLCVAEASPALGRCTISGNGALTGSGAIHCTDAAPVLNGCIVWENVGASIVADADSRPAVTGSCIEGGFPGEGNVDVDPRFCGYDGRLDIYANAANPQPGDGTEGNPYRELAPALAFSYAPAADSPCLGMGVPLEPCPAGAATQPRIHVAPGTYSILGLSLVHGASVIGAAPETTIVRGTVFGLAAGALLSNVTVTGGTAGGVVVQPGAAPRIENCIITENFGSGIVCTEGSAPAIRDCRISRNDAESGGGIYAEGASPSIADCTISENIADWGGALSCKSGGTATVVRTAITANWAWSGGGVISARASIELSECGIIGNMSQYDAGGIQCYGNPAPPGAAVTAVNCIIAGNAEHGVLAGDRARVVLVNTTIAQNRAYDLYCGGTGVGTLKSCIVFGQAASEAPLNAAGCVIGRDPLFAANGVFDFARMQPIEIGGVSFAVPDFTVSEPDYRLQLYSPALNIGINEGAPAADIDGVARPCYGTVDAGAYELCGLGPNEPPALSVSPDHANLEICGGPAVLALAATASDPEAAELRYEWTSEPAAVVTGAGASAEVWLPAAGDYTVTCIVRDGIHAASVAVPVRVTSCGGLMLHVGDVNNDMHIDIADAIRTLAYLFANADEPPCLASADANGSGSVDIADAITVLGYLFSGRAMHGPEGIAIPPGGDGCFSYAAEVVTIECATPCTP